MPICPPSITYMHVLPLALSLCCSQLSVGTCLVLQTSLMDTPHLWCAPARAGAGLPRDVDWARGAALPEHGRPGANVAR